MKYYVRTRENFARDTFAKVGAVWEKDREETPSFMLVERGWNQQKQKPVSAFFWMPIRVEATGFPTAEAAWTAFDLSGHGRREDYCIEEAA